MALISEVASLTVDEACHGNLPRDPSHHTRTYGKKGDLSALSSVVRVVESGKDWGVLETPSISRRR
jgi:hypothetical protein